MRQLSVAGAIVAVRPTELDVEQSLSKTVDGSGEVEFSKLAAGEYEMLSRLAGKAPRLEPVTVGAGTATVDAPLSQGAELAGTVTGDGGAGIRGAIVWAIDPVTGTTTSDATDGDGDYLIDDLSPGAAELWFTAARPSRRTARTSRQAAAPTSTPHSVATAVTSSSPRSAAARAPRCRACRSRSSTPASEFR